MIVKLLQWLEKLSSMTLVASAMRLSVPVRVGGLGYSRGSGASAPAGRGGGAR